MNKIFFGMKYCYRILPIIGFLFFLHTNSAAQKIGELDLDKLDNYLEEARIAWQVPGLSIAIVKDDSVVFARGYGHKESGKEGMVDENTIFSIASITKGFTSTALAMLADEGKIFWDDQVRTYLPDFSLYDPWVSKEITIRDLLCHRSGLKTFSGDLLWFETDYSRDELLRRVQFLEPSYSFRYNFGYSNLMYLAAGEIIPVVSEMSWDKYIDTKLLQPLGMNRTYLKYSDLEMDPNFAMPHHVNLLDKETYVLPYWNLDNIAPAFAINSCAMDMSRWIRFQLRMGLWDDEQLVSMENLWETRKMHTARPVEMGDSRFWPSRHFNGYGLGWDIYDYHGWKVVGHEGGTDGMLSRLVMVPEENFGYVILTNSMSALTIGLEYFILDQYYQGKSYDWSAIYLENSNMGLVQQKSDWEEYLESADRSLKPSKKLKEYQGIYGGDLYGDLEVSLHKGSLVLDFLPAPGLIGDLESFSADTFLIRMRDKPALPLGTVKFLLDERGEVSELVIDIPSPDFDFTELKLNKR
ncbi:serine hydrolase [Bacteroidota bacterium]